MGTFDAFQRLVWSPQFKQNCFPHRSKMGVLKSFLTFIEAEPGVCQDGKCNMLFYRDGDHLRASFVKDKAVWIDRIFE